MKKKFSDPLIFSNVLLSGITVGPSQTGGFGQLGPAVDVLDADQIAPIDIVPDAEETSPDIVGAEDVQIVTPDVPEVFDETDIQSVIDQIVEPAPEEAAAGETGITE